MYRIWIIIVIVFIGSCNSSTEISTESKILNNFANKANIQTVNLDTHSIDTLNSEFFVKFSLNLEKKNVFVNDITGMGHTKEYFYLFTDENPFVIQFNRNGDFLQTFHPEGKGPGELMSLDKATITDEYIILLDATNSRISLFDHSMNFQKGYNVKGVDYTGHYSNFEATSKRILMQNTANTDSVIKVYSLNDGKEVKNIMPRIIPAGMQPAAVNGYLASINNTNGIVTSYFGLPYIFHFNDSFELKKTIIVKAKYFQESIPSLIPQKERSGHHVGVTLIISNLNWFEQNKILMVNRNVISIIKTENSDAEIIKRFRFDFPDAPSRRANDFGVRIEFVSYDESYFYVTSNLDNGIYRVSRDVIGI